MRKCYKCGAEKHISQFYSKGKKMCKSCFNSIALLHRFIESLFIDEKKEGICQICNEYKKRLELANTNGHNYSKEKKDYILICCRCHYEFDLLKHSRNNQT